MTPIDWEDEAGWGGRVHVADWCPDPKHEDETGDQ